MKIKVIYLVVVLGISSLNLIYLMNQGVVFNDISLSELSKTSHAFSSEYCEEETFYGQETVQYGSETCLKSYTVTECANWNDSVCWYGESGVYYCPSGNYSFIDTIDAWCPDLSL